MALTAKSIFSKTSIKIKKGVVVVNKENFEEVSSIIKILIKNLETLIAMILKFI